MTENPFAMCKWVYFVSLESHTIFSEKMNNQCRLCHINRTIRLTGLAVKGRIFSGKKSAVIRGYWH